LNITAALEALRTGEESTRRQVVDALAASGQPEAVLALLLAVGDESWPVRQAAAAHLERLPLDTLLPVLESALRDGENAGTRNAAMEIYVRRGEAAVPALLTLLRDEDEEVRNFAAVMLGPLKDRRAVLPLMTALLDPDVNVRHAAAAALGQIGDPAAVMPLVDALRTEPWLTYPAIHALGEIADPRAAPALLDLLDDEFFRGPALEALGGLADRTALSRLVPHLQDPEPVLRNAAIRAVVAIEERATAAGESLDPEVQKALRRDDLVAHLLDMLGDDDALNRRTAAITLGWLREPRAVRPLVELLGQAGLQEHASHGLVSVGFQDPAAFEDGLRHPDDAVRAGTVRCLSWIAPEGAVALVAPLIHDPATEVRAETVAAIGRLGDEDAAMLLFELLGDESELIQESAMSALHHLSGERVLPLLVQALQNSEPAVRVRAAEALGRLREGATAPALVSAARDPRESVRRAALRALGEMDAPEVVSVLRAGLSDESSLVRQQAAASLGKTGETEVAADLLPLLADPDPKMRFVAVQALGRIGSAKALPALLLRLEDEDATVRRAATAALGELRDARAARPLLRALGEPDLRGTAAEALRRLGATALAELERAYGGASPEVRKLLVEIVGRLDDPAAGRLLLAALGDAEAAVRAEAALAMGDGERRFALRALMDLKAKDPSPEVRKAAAQSLQKLAPR
jgi:HEAT repeat protein